MFSQPEFPAGGRRIDRAWSELISRRQALAMGGLSTMGLAWLPGPEAVQAASDHSGRAKSVIVLYLLGGPSHLDTWDPKPNGPSAIRGEFGVIPTRVPGTVYCEHLPKLAARNDRFTLVRSITHERNVHGGAVGFVLTGTRPNDPGIPGVRGPDASPLDHPCLGAVVTQYAPATRGLPSAVTLPWEMIDGQGRSVPGQTAGLLGRKADPWYVYSDPNSPNFRVEGLTLPQGLSSQRLDQRHRLLGAITQGQSAVEPVTNVAALGDYYERAFDLLSSDATRRAFDLSQEPAALRAQYGRNTFGQSCLLARRLVEAGVKLVTVNMGNGLFGDFGWDTHSKNFPQHKDVLLPKFDPAFAALLDDLEQRNLFDDTLVVVLSEFGRSPKIQSNGGRDHWPQCYSAIFAGGGVRRGFELGQSDAMGAYPHADPVTPEDLVASIYSAIGIDPHRHIYDATGRGHQLVRGRVLQEIWS